MPKATLTISGDRPEPESFEIDGEAIIGRSVRATIQIEGDLVSRQHGRIAFRDDEWHFEDLGSRNGSLVNGERTTEAVLQSGDIVQIGYGRILFETIGAAQSSEFAVSFVESDAELESALIADVVDDEDGATVALSFQNLVEINQRLMTIAKTSRNLATVLDRDELLEQVLRTLFELFDQIDRSAIVLRDANDVFQVLATRQRGGAVTTMSVMRISTSLINFVRKEGKAVLSADTAQDDRFADRASIVGSSGRSIMCAPLAVKDEFLGVIYLDTESIATPFTHQDLNLLQGIAGPMAIFLKNTELVQAIEQETQMRTSLSRYLSPDVVRQIGEGSLDANLGGDMAEGTVMFSDIVGFTAMSEKLKPAEVVNRLNRYFTSMLEAIFGWEGTVDKFGGDAILVVWGAPMMNEEHAHMATAAALEMQARLFELNLQLAEAGGTQIHMAVGLNSGRFVAGNIGGQERIEWTVIGDTVNLAQRVESQGFTDCVLVSETTFAGCEGSAGAYGFPPVQVKNREEPVTIHSIRTLRTLRGVLAALPVTVSWDDNGCRGVVTKIHTKGKKRLAMKVAGDPRPGTEVTITADLPERDGAMSVIGRVAASAPLLDIREGRAVDVDVESADEELERLFAAEGSVAASRSLAEIER